MKLRVTYLLGLLLSGLLLGCSEGEEPVPQIGVIVQDEDGVRLSGAEVQIYSSRDDYRNDSNPILETVTDDNGLAIITYTDSLEVLRLRPIYISAERGERNNWTGQITYQLEVNAIATVEVRPSLESRLAGRWRRTWEKVRYIIDGQEINSCNTLSLVTFELSGNMGIEQTPECGDRFLGNDIWEVTDENTYQTFAETRVITDLTETTMRVTYVLGGAISVQEDYVLFED